MGGQYLPIRKMSEIRHRKNDGVQERGRMRETYYSHCISSFITAQPFPNLLLIKSRLDRSPLNSLMIRNIPLILKISTEQLLNHPCLNRGTFRFAQLDKTMGVPRVSRLAAKFKRNSCIVANLQAVLMMKHSFGRRSAYSGRDVQTSP